jgi:hypothetical protein
MATKISFNLGFILSIILLIQIAQFGNGIIRNNRVILHDEHLPNGADPEEELEENGRQRPSTATRNGEEEPLDRAKRALMPEWRGEEWRKKALEWGQTEEEQNRQFCGDLLGNIWKD